MRALVEQQPENESRWGQLARIEALRGEPKEALRCARKAVALLPTSRDTWLGPRREADLAFVLAWTGDKTGAITIYTRLLTQPGTFLNIHEMKRGLEFHPLQGDPRYEALLNDPKNNAPLF